MGEQPDSRLHDKYLTLFLQVIRKQNLKLNISKLQYKTKCASFFGTIFTSVGHKPEKEKFQATNKIPQPTNVKAL